MRRKYRVSNNADEQKINSTANQDPTKVRLSLKQKFQVARRPQVLEEDLHQHLLFAQREVMLAEGDRDRRGQVV